MTTHSLGLPAPARRLVLRVPLGLVVPAPCCRSRRGWTGPRIWGQVLLAGVAQAGVHRDIGVIFQEPRLFPWLTVGQNIALGQGAGAGAAAPPRWNACRKKWAWKTMPAPAHAARGRAGAARGDLAQAPVKAGYCTD
ncbi:hypothetical protein F2P45_04720 [Massilia sp. CCM 8733]|uniref:Uncharacterized protein n=1 Tax=Massilia mucilaginosa TaxID=2609282 RepID=A0ABX0NNI9_9BURK|nr:hypothetical protein [Massilia mucilaginosa]NHZ88333.1 hypothetical protein [Massilia mucilaginosa]